MSENRKIAKNSLILYIRMIITTVIGLYSSRIILSELGAEGFGLYTVVGGIVVMLNILNSSMITTSNRYIAIEIGKVEGKETNKIFNTLIIIHLSFSIVLFILIETAGVWYVKNYLNVKTSEISDALFVLHLSTITAIISTIIIPFQGLITANEKFNIRATAEILQSILNLGAVLLLIFNENNKLRTYAIYVLIIQVIIGIYYVVYARIRYYDIVKWKINRRIHEYKEISRFFGWQMIYVLGTVGVNQGGSLIMNLFFGTVINAAYGIASRVNDFVFTFVKNINQAAVPQIMKSYSGGDKERTVALIYLLPKYTYFIMLIPAVPIILSVDTILEYWLKTVPSFTAIFVILRIIHGLISCLESGFDATIDASGKIRNTKIFFTILFLLTLPVIYYLYKIGLPPYIITFIFITSEIIFLSFQTRILAKISEFDSRVYLKTTIYPIGLVTILILPQLVLNLVFGEGIFYFSVKTLISFILTLTTIYVFGLKNSERAIINENIYKIIVRRIGKRCQV